jgi:hypothetical protein
MPSSQVPSINQSSIINQSLIILERPTGGPTDTNYVPNDRQQATDNRQTGTPVEAWLTLVNLLSC